VKKIKRKVLVTVLALAVVLLATQIAAVVPVQAAPKENLDFALNIEGISVSYGPWGTYHAGPRGTEEANPDPKPLIQRTFHAKEVEFMFLYAELNIGDENYYLDTGSGWSIAGVWDFLCAGSFTHRYVIMQYGDMFGGFGTYPAEGNVVYYEQIFGAINRMTGEVVMNGVYYSDPDYTNPTGYTFTAALTIDPSDGSMDGILTSQDDLSFDSTSGAAVYVEKYFGIAEEHSFNFNWNTLTGQSKAEDTIIFYDSGGEVWGTLPVSVRDTIVYVFNEQGGLANLISEGNIFGKGTGALKDAKIAGTTSGEVAYWVGYVPVMGLTREGTITGWTTPP
jgi:hypothetical protein